MDAPEGLLKRAPFIVNAGGKNARPVVWPWAGNVGHFRKGGGFAVARWRGWRILRMRLAHASEVAPAGRAVDRDSRKSARGDARKK